MNELLPPIHAQQNQPSPGKGPSSGGKGPGGQGGPGAAPPRRPGLTLVMLLGLMVLVGMVLFSGGPEGQEQPLPTLIEYAKQGKLKDGSIVIETGRVVAEVKENATAWSAPAPAGDAKAPGTATQQPTRIYSTILPDDYGWIRNQLTAAGVGWSEENTGQSWFMALLPSLLSLGVLIFIFWFFMRGLRSAGGGPGGMLGNFGKSRHRLQTKDSTGITFKDVAGIEEAKEEVSEIVEFLKNPKKFARLGGRIPRGVLLSGPPGCGKTMLAKAIAGEADAPFFSISGSDFVEMFVGVGASRVRDLFKQAKENAPCIIFLDEIDAVGRRRGGGFNSGGHDEREQTLNAILVEMDGFEASDQVIVIAGTNRLDVLDPALTRPGRFDRSIQVPLPDVKGRAEILAVHAKKVKMGPDVDLARIAKATPMFSGADLAALINESAIIATMAEKDFIEQSDLEEARDKVRWGRANKSRRIEQQEREATAYHEAGHAVLQMLLKDADPLHKVTIIPRGQAMGVTFSLPEKDRYGYSRRFMEATMRVLCAGRLAEGRHTGDISSGAGMDIQMVTAYARAMVLKWGMSDRLGFVNYAGEDSREMYIPEKDYSPETARIIDEEIRRISDEAYDEARRMVEQHWTAIDAVAQALLKYETLTRDEVEKLMRGEKLEKSTVSDLLQREFAASKPAPAPAAGPDAEPPAGALPSPA
jgi:cell division protease FtsH